MKRIHYEKLVEKRKKFDFSEGLVNPSKTQYDTDELEPLAQWQHNLDAEVMVVGQDFCDVDTYNECKGSVELYENKYEYLSNENLWEFLNLLGIDPGHPCHPNLEAKLFFTNAVMALKVPEKGSINKKMSSPVKDSWLNESRKEFLEPLIKIIQPKAIICVGSKATKSILKIYNKQFVSLGYHVVNPLINQIPHVFPVFHTGKYGIRRARSKNDQIQDWQKIGEILKL